MNKETNNNAMNDNETKKDGATPGVAESSGGRFYELLVSWGVPGVIAAAVIGAVYAALVALGVLGLPGCTVSVDVLPGGGQHFDGALVLPQTINSAK